MMVPRTCCPWELRKLTAGSIWLGEYTVRICRRPQGKRLPSGTLTPATARGAAPHPRQSTTPASVPVMPPHQLKACLKPFAGQAYDAGLGVSRSNPLREDRRMRPTAALGIKPSRRAGQQRGNGNRATANRLERCTPLTPATRGFDARHAAASQIVSQGESRTVILPERRIVPAPSTAMMPKQYHTCIRAIQPVHVLTSWLPDDAIDCTCRM